MDEQDLEFDWLETIIEVASNTSEHNIGLQDDYIARERILNRGHQASYRQKHPAAIKARTANARSKRGGRVREHQITALYNQQQGKCHWCKTDVGNDYHIDHVVPLSRGGSNDIGNLVISCPYCNKSRGNKLPEEMGI